MSKIELFLIVGACLAPIVALLFVLPKKLKKQVNEHPPTTPYVSEEPKKEETPSEQPVKEVEKEVKEEVSIQSDDVYNTDDFKNYINLKREQTRSPYRLKEPDDVFTEEYLPPRLRRKKQQVNKPISQQIKDLSPELKAMLLTGVLDKKDYDDYINLLMG